jgi:hypothetical protein
MAGCSPAISPKPDGESSIVIQLKFNAKMHRARGGAFFRDPG